MYVLKVRTGSPRGSVRVRSLWDDNKRTTNRNRGAETLKKMIVPHWVVIVPHIHFLVYSQILDLWLHRYSQPVFRPTI